MKHLLLLSILTAFYFEIIACRCHHMTKTFMTSISEFTAELEVVEIDSIDSEINTSYWSLVLTKLKIIQSFNSDSKVHYLWMSNTIKFDCTRGLSPDYIGQKYIMTGSLYPNDSYDQWFENHELRVFLAPSSCGKTILEIEGDFIFGEITKNKSDRIGEKYRELMQNDEVIAKAYYDTLLSKKHHSERVQKMLLSDFYKLINCLKEPN